METTQQEHRLYKSRSRRMIAGVCGGVAEYFSVDVTLVRLGWAFATLFGGWGLLAYLAAALIMPSRPEAVGENAGATPSTPPRESPTPFWGILLIVVGVLWVAANLGFHFFVPWWGFSWKGGIGVLLIVAGIMVLFNKGSVLSGSPHEAGASPSSGSGTTNASQAGRLSRSLRDNVIFGVCGGLAAHLRIDPVIVRLVFVLTAFGSLGLVVLIYLIFAAILPMEDATPRSATA
jgi:phage shock protein C